MNKALLSIGTNEDRDRNLDLCHQLLEKQFLFIAYSKTSMTVPYGNSYKSDFLNQLAFIYTDKEKDEVVSLLKSIEKEIGRSNGDKEKGIVKIDVDLIVWNEEVVKPTDISRSYVSDLLPSLEEALL
ncbi:2-amino-4-hydroxy-6-hydroxymethyldihydropteridine diphosphokinase [Dysgonomonas sp. Marseille-P4361]|uniref:2-amino-4-hydroxy-6- hydroxymethyldihydropteridine diphosphokinase n=1 Tax=Dysgonomonas sp. Marseille-P4361 TaxID=2161820 RepID=UPI000D54F4AC|nr:2-amino-4-hydroxy-6-hydroxymethyldihydropteridine diphosphokinase [Dysgonomonas sp. Marseille-P4361]